MVIDRPPSPGGGPRGSSRWSQGGCLRSPRLSRTTGSYVLRRDGSAFEGVPRPAASEPVDRDRADQAGTDGVFGVSAGRASPASSRRGWSAWNGPNSTRIRPRLRARLDGSIVTGRVPPARAGSVVLRHGRHGSSASARPAGFEPGLRMLRAGKHAVRVSVRPATGRVSSPALRAAHPPPEPGIGSHGPGVLALKRRLSDGHALRPSTPVRPRDLRGGACLPKVHGLPRTGRVDRRFWRVLAGAWRSPASASRAATTSRSASRGRRSTKCGTERSSVSSTSRLARRAIRRWAPGASTERSLAGTGAVPPDVLPARLRDPRLSVGAGVAG